MNFVAIQEATGIQAGTDGILGLSASRWNLNNKFHLIDRLREEKVIKKSIVSFSITTTDQ
jgi:hypothetical protein